MGHILPALWPGLKARETARPNFYWFDPGMARDAGIILSILNNLDATPLSPYRLEVEGGEYFIDLLLYHRALKCLVAVDLKIGKFYPFLSNRGGQVN